MVNYADNELWSSTTRSPFPRIQPETALSKTIGAITGAPTLEVGYPLAYNDNVKAYVPWSAGATGGIDEIVAFVYPEDIASSATQDVMGIIMLKGEIHYDDIIIPDGESEADLKAALQDGPLARGLIIRGLPEVR